MIECSMSSLSPESIALLMENQRSFLGYLVRRLGDRALAEDVLQDALARSISTASSVRDDAALLGWFQRTLKNTLVDHARRADARKRAYESLAHELEEGFDPELDGKNRVCRCIARLATELEPNLAAVIRRVDVEGATIAEYAAETGITANNARVRLFRARSSLRTKVKASCGACAENGCVDCTCAPETEKKSACCS